MSVGEMSLISRMMKFLERSFLLGLFLASCSNGFRCVWHKHHEAPKEKEVLAFSHPTRYRFLIFFFFFLRLFWGSM